MDYPRPRRKIIPSDADKFMERWALLAVVFLWIFAAFNYKSLPSRIPSHFNLAGEIDGYGNRWLIFLIPIIGTLLYSGLTFINNYPHNFNYLRNITEENAEAQYRLATTMVRQMKLIICFIFLIIELQIVNSARSGKSPLAWWDLPILLVFIFLPLAIYLYKSGKIK